MELRGTILLRNTVEDTVFVLQTERLEQVGTQRQQQRATNQAFSQQQYLPAAIAAAPVSVFVLVESACS